MNQLAKTHCPRGHAYAGENLVMQRNQIGRAARVCRTCKNAANARYRAEVEARGGISSKPTTRVEAYAAALEAGE